MSLRWRFALLFASGAIIATLVAAGAAVFTARRAVFAEIDGFLRTRAEFTLELPASLIVRSFGGDLPLELPTSGRGLGSARRQLPVIVSPDAITQWNAPSGDLLVKFEDVPELPAPDLEAAGEIDTIRVGDARYRRIVTIGRDGNAVQVARDVTPELAVLDTMRRRIFLLGLVVATGSGLIGWVLARRTVQPVEELTEAAEEIARTSELLDPIAVSGSDEVARLAASFNSMLAALADSREQQRRLVQDAGHELRTPLTSLRTNIEVLQRSPQLVDEERVRLLADVDAELRELSDLVAELVTLATDPSADDESPVQIDLRTLVDRVVERAGRRTDRQIAVTGSGTTLELRQTEIERAIGNLIDNAAKWGPGDRPIEIAVAGTGVSVRDHGPGINEADLPRVFERFYRADEARSTPGSGLGLAIVEQIVRRHGGRVHAANAPDGGAIVGFDLTPS